MTFKKKRRGKEKAEAIIFYPCKTIYKNVMIVAILASSDVYSFQLLGTVKFKQKLRDNLIDLDSGIFLSIS